MKHKRNRSFRNGMHNRLVLFLSVIGLFLSGTAIVTAQENLIINGGFEDGKTGWTSWEGTFEITDDAHSGNSAARISNRSETWHSLVQNVKDVLVNGSSYKIKAWVKIPDPAVNFRATLQLTIGENSTYTSLMRTSEPVIGNYANYSQEFIVTWEGTLADANIYFETEAVGGVYSDYIVDDVELYELLPDTAPVPLRPGLKDIKSTLQIGGVATDGTKNFFTSETVKSLLLSDCDVTQVQCYPAWGRWDNTYKHVYHIEDFSSQVRELEEEGIPVTAHMLMGWDQYYPDWFKTGDFEVDTLDSLMHGWIATIIGSNGNDTLVDCWNVVNEAISWDGHGGYFPIFNEDYNSACEFQRMGFETDQSGLTGEQYVNTEHPVYIRKAFEYARMYTDKKLELRETSMEFPNSQKYHAFYQLAKHLKNSGAPVDAIGFQTHLNIGEEYDWDGYIANIKRFKELGYEVNITEVDIGDQEKDWSEDKAQEQKVLYYKLIKAAIEAGANEFHTWGFIDNNNAGWRSGENAFTFNEDIEMKPAYFGIQEALIDMSHILFWRMDEEVEGVMQDVMPYGNDGTLTNVESPSFVEGTKGNAMQFDGVDDLILVDQLSENIMQDLTVSAFIKTESTDSSVIVHLSNESTNNLLIGLNSTGHVFAAANSQLLASSIPVNDNNWHYIALQRDSLTYCLYIDGAEADAIAGGNIEEYSQFVLGAKADGTEAYSGAIDEVKLYNWAIEEASLTRTMMPAQPLSLNFFFSPSLKRMYLNWKSQGENEDGYIIELKLDDGEWSEIGRVDAGVVNYQHTMEVYDTEHTYRVRSFNQFGISDPSNEVSQMSPSDPALGMKNHSENHILCHIFPNPVSDQLTIQSKENATLRIYNEQGSLVLEREIQNKEEVLNVHSFPKGVYLVQVIYGDDVNVLKFVKR